MLVPPIGRLTNEEHPLTSFDLSLFRSGVAAAIIPVSFQTHSRLALPLAAHPSPPLPILQWNFPIMMAVWKLGVSPVFPSIVRFLC